MTYSIRGGGGGFRKTIVPWVLGGCKRVLGGGGSCPLLVGVVRYLGEVMRVAEPWSNRVGLLYPSGGCIFLFYFLFQYSF